MYNVTNNTFIYCYTITGYNSASGQFDVDHRKTLKFKNLDTLLNFLAARIKKPEYCCINYYPSIYKGWECEYFNQNLYGNDIWTDTSLFFSTTPVYYRRRYLFIDAYDRIINIKDYFNQILDRYKSGNYIYYSDFYYHDLNSKYHYRHHYCYTRHSTQNWHTKHGYVNKRYAYNEPIVYDYETEEPVFHINEYKPKAKDKELLGYWWDDFTFSRRSAGWKDHKYRHQWEHNVVNKFKHNKNKTRKYFYDELGDIMYV